MESTILLILSGISGSGKTTLGKYLASDFLGKSGNKWSFIDQDTYYRKEKPQVELSNGKIVSNWDCEQALDLETLRSDLVTRLKSTNVVFSGFAARDQWLNLKSVQNSGVRIFHIHLVTDENPEIIIKKCIDARSISKKTGEIDTLKVRELVYPFYVETLKHSTIDKKIPVYQENVRKSVAELASEIQEFIRNSKFMS